MWSESVLGSEVDYQPTSAQPSPAHVGRKNQATNRGEGRLEALMLFFSFLFFPQIREE
jgi:hypothetical protein